MDTLKINTAVECSVWVAAPREQAWEAITDPKQIEQWFCPGSAWEVSVLEIGGKVILHSTDIDADIHTIEIFDPPHQFALRWEPDAPVAPLITIYTLEEKNGGTRVTVKETGFDLLPIHIRRQRIAQAAQGNTENLENLKACLEGRSLPYVWSCAS